MGSKQIWQPLSLADLLELLRDIKIPWYVAGGWAIDLFIGHQTRLHEDLDIVIFRRDQQVLKRYLTNWDLQACDPPGSHRSWGVNEYLSNGINNVWCRKSPSSPWALQIMFMDSEDNYWVFRRDQRIKCSIEDIGSTDLNGIPYLRPEIQLLFKATSLSREKDALDFKHVIPHLTQSARGWLKKQLQVVNPKHPWLHGL